MLFIILSQSAVVFFAFYNIPINNSIFNPEKGTTDISKNTIL
jgi:hypothetical protein